MHHDYQKHCAFCDPPHMERNNYYFGKLMTVRDFFAEQNYFNQKRWLINKTVIGAGVVCGLDIKSHDDKSVILTKGLAIDCCGREILNCREDYCVPLDPVKPHNDPPKPDLTSDDRQSSAQQSNSHENRDDFLPETLCKDEPIPWHAPFERYGHRYLLCAEYKSCETEVVNIPVEDCGQNEQHKFNRIRDSFEILVKWEWEVLQEQQHHDHDHKYDDHHFWPASRPPQERPVPLVHDSICNHLRKGCPSCTHHCLILGRVIVWPEGKPLPDGAESSVWIQPCHQRKLVYNNPLLFDLIHSHHGDLPHVRCTNWKHGQRCEWDENPNPDPNAIWNSNQIYRDGIRVRFDKPMNGDSINSRTVLVSVTIHDEGTGQYWNERVPVEDPNVEYDPATQTATFKFSYSWLKDTYAKSHFLENDGDFFIVLKGDFIMSTQPHPKALDGNFLNGQLPSGNGVQGGDFVSWFIMPKLPDPLKAELKKQQRRSRQ